MGFAAKANIGGNEHTIASSLFGICSTAGATAAKVVTCPDFDTLISGVTIAVKFIYTNTAVNPTLNVNGTGALPIYVSGTKAPGVTPLSSWTANSVVNFTYDGNAWIMNDTIASAILDAVYPVGSIYMSVNSVSPEAVLGGTWEQIQDKFLLAAGGSYAAGTTGGSATHAHTTANHTLTASEIPAHTHGSKSLTGHGHVWRWNSDPGEERIGIVHWEQKGTGSSLVENGGGGGGAQLYIDATHEHNSVGGNGAHNHGNTGDASTLPPYLAVYVWKRTA